MKKINKIAKKITASMEDKIQALKLYLELDDEQAESIENIYDEVYSWENMEYFVLTDDQANEKCYEEIQSLIDDCGPDAINGYENFIDEHYFDDAMQESIQSYCYDIGKYEKDEEFGNRLVRECYENNLIEDSDFEQDEEGNAVYNQCKLDNDELTQRYVEWRCDQQSSLDYMLEIDTPRDLIKYNPNCINMDDLVDYVVSSDGRGHVLSSYDGRENQIQYGGEYYYIYRLN